MVTGIKKYNPGFLSDDEIVASFCVRNAELESLLESLYSSTGNSNAHSLVIGPRGSGKSHLLLRVAAEIRRNESLSGFYPIVFAEESYEVSTIGEFWLGCLEYLAEQAVEEERADLRLSHGDLRTVRDDRELANRCLGSILDYADRHGKRMVLVVENLNMLFADMGDPDAGWRLRHTLQTEPRIVLLGSATSRFDEIDHPDHALYDLFRVVTLHPLDIGECVSLWRTVSGREAEERVVRPLQILTGGNPRLLAIIARFGAGSSFDDLMDSLLDLVDDHTEYFKSHLESLPPQERRIYLALATLWRPATAREVAEQARMDVNVTSALLKRLVERGAVTIDGGTPRRRQYYLTERLYNIYYLLRRGSGESQVVKALIDFMACLYSPAVVWDAFSGAIRHVPDVRTLRPRLADLFAERMLDEADHLAELGQTEDALAVHDDIIRRLTGDDECVTSGWIAMVLMEKMQLLRESGRDLEAMAICDDLITCFGGREEVRCVLAVTVARNFRALASLDAGQTSAVVSQLDQSLAQLCGMTTPLNGLDGLDGLGEGVSFFTKGVVLMRAGQLPAAAAAFDEVVAREEALEEWGSIGLVAAALEFKETALDTPISEEEASTLLRCLAQTGEIDVVAMRALLQFTVRAGAHRALEIFEASQACALLLPLVTALRQGIGQATHVAKEVDEVAEDVRQELLTIELTVPEGVFIADVPLQTADDVDYPTGC